MTAARSIRRRVGLLMAVQCGLGLALGSWGLIAPHADASLPHWLPVPAVVLTASLALALLCIFVAVRGLCIVAELTRYLGSIVDVARSYAQGNLSARVTPRGPAEFRALADAVNQMAEEMARGDRQLEAALNDAARQRDRLSAIINATSDGLLLYDPSRRILAANQRCAELLGFRLERLLEEPLAVLEFEIQARSRQPEHYRDHLERHFTSPEAAHQDIMELERPQRRILRRYSGPLLNDGVVSGRVFTYTDITPETDLDRMKSEFVSMASHELRTPLTSIHGALQLALMGSGELVEQEDRELLEISLASTERLVRLVNDLLDLSKIEAGRMPRDPQPLDVVALVEEAARGMQGLAAPRNMHVDVRCDAGVSRVLGDRDQLLRVLANLLSNAIKYSPEGSPVEVNVVQSGMAVEFSVLDHGPGIPPDQIDRLFKPFTRVGCHERQVTGGSGLGLAISRAIVLQHGGRIWAERGRRDGSRFAFTVPAEFPAQAAVASGLQEVA